MKKIGKYILGCFISILIMSAFWIHPVYAETTVAQLSLHAYGNSLTGSSNGNVGHAFLSIKIPQIQLKFSGLSNSRQRDDYGIYLAG